MRRLNQFSRISLFLLTGLLLSGYGVAASAPSAAVVATVNGVAIPQSDLEAIVKQQVAAGGKDTPELRKSIRDALVTQQILVQEGVAEGVDKTADFQTGLKLARADALRGALLDNYVKAHPSKATKPEERNAEMQKVVGTYVTDLKAKAKIVDKAGLVAEVNGVAIPKSDADFIIQHQVEQGGKDTPEMRAKVRDFLVMQQVFVQEASKLGLDKTTDFQVTQRFVRSEVLRGELFTRYVKANPISAAAMKAEFDKRSAAIPPMKEYHSRHILVKTESDAKDVMAALKAGQTFEAVAKAKSIDPGSKDQGGDLGWVTPDKFVKEFSTAMVALKKGDTTATPVKSQFGYHVIKLEDVRSLPLPTFDQVKVQLQQVMQRELIGKWVESLKTKAKVV